VSDNDLPPLTVGPDGPDGPLADGGRERRRGRTRWRVAAVGSGLAILGAVAVGVVTGSGRSSLAALFVGLSLASGVTAVVTLIGAARDEFRGDRVPRRRIVAGLVLLVAAPFFLVLAAGATGTA
jgi:hypothetical protein